MGDVDVQAQLRRAVGLILLGLAVVIGVAFALAYVFVPDLVVLDLGGPLVGVGLFVGFATASLPLLIPQREPPTDPRHSRWYIAFGLWASLIPMTGMGYHPDDHTILATSIDGERSVVLYHPRTWHPCLRIWSGVGPMARVVGEIGDPGWTPEAYFQTPDTILLTPDGTDSDWRFSVSAERIRLDPRSGRPLDHTDRPCRTASDRVSR